MALRDLAGIFSRAFVVGCYIPAFAGLFVIDLSVDMGALPPAYNDLEGGTQLLVLGGVALMLALLLWGLQHPIFRTFQGYGLEAVGRARVGGWPVYPFSWLYDLAMSRQTKRFDALTATAEHTDNRVSSPALKELNRAWPPTASGLLPTRIGNVVRASDWYPRSRYNLNGIYVYPRISTMLNEAEREIDADARTDLSFFLNIALLTVLVGVYVLADSLWHGWWNSVDLIPAVAIPPVVYIAATRAARGAADRWGAGVRTSFDMHRLDLYDQVGLRRPCTHEEEHEIGAALNRLLVYGRVLPNHLRAKPEAKKGAP